MTPSLRLLPRGDDELSAALSCAVALRDYLQHAKRLVDEQIRAYPKPIPRCDAQFNYLYEQRNRLSAALDEANAAIDAKDSASDLEIWVMNILSSAPWSEDEPERELRQRLRDRIGTVAGGMLPPLA